LLSLLGVTSPSLLNHGRVGLDRVEGHVRAPVKPYESRVHDSGGASDSCMLEDSTSTIQAGGYVVACATFYEQGFGVPSH
jgi:hypothetical protein